MSILNNLGLIVIIGVLTIALTELWSQRKLCEHYEERGDYWHKETLRLAKAELRGNKL